MKKYKTKSKMFGYKIGLQNDNLYIAIPKKYFIDEVVEVECDGEKKTYSVEDKFLEATQLDKFGKGLTYTLYYFLWK
jgi:hypothetical protein